MKHKKRKDAYCYCIPETRHVMQKEAVKKLKYKEFFCTSTTNLKHEMYDYTCTNWRHRNSNENCKETFGSHIRTFNTFTGSREVAERKGL